jgi:acetylornithine/N-succinyldiaminopimelate aminotransferase
MYHYARTKYKTFSGFPMTLLDRERVHLFHTYKRLPLEIERGRGMFLTAADGTRYLDMFSGLAVNALGYAHPAVLKAIRSQSARYIHLSNYYLQEPQIRLAELLAKQTGYPRVFFCNSGTEAIEGAIKISRKWGNRRKKKDMVALSNAFHGRTMGALSLMDRPKYRDGFEPFLKHFLVAQFNDPQSLRRTVGSNTAAVILEFVQGEGGIRPVSNEFVAALLKLKNEYGFLLVADEIQSGVGRTGKFFAFEHYDVKPDLIVIAKPIGGGLPLGAILGTEVVADVLQPGMHGTTFGGNPVACAAGTAVISEIVDHGLMRNAERMGFVLRSALLDLKKQFPGLVRDVRSLGLMAGMELAIECEPIVGAMREKHILINCTDKNVLRFLPPLIVRKEHINRTKNALNALLAEVAKRHAE